MKPNIKFNPKDGRFTASASDLAALNALLRETANSGKREMHEAMGTVVIGPIKQVAAYKEWTNLFFAPRPIPDGEVIRVALSKPSMTALYTSTAGDVLFTRPGRSYTTVDTVSVDTGLEVGWDDLRNSGWNVMEDLMQQSGEQFARKRDELGQAVLDAAVTTASSNEESTGLLLNRTTVDHVFKHAATLGWKIDRVAVNSGTIMDMAGWTNPSNSMWQFKPELGDQIIANGYVTNYGGAAWYANPSVPADHVYMSASPTDLGSFKFERGGTRSAQDIDIKKRIDLYTWDENLGYYIGNPYAIWRIDIVQGT